MLPPFAHYILKIASGGRPLLKHERRNPSGEIEIIAPKARITHCLRGHEYSPENTRITSDGRRKCRACDRARVSRNYFRDKNGRKA